MTVFMRALILAALIASASDAPAQPAGDDENSANFLYSGCKVFASGQRVSDYQTAMAANYCSGIVHALSGIGEFLNPPEWKSCAPPSSADSQLARVGVKFLEEHRERMHEDFRGLVVEAFHGVWPCPAGR
jgi:hypothetical protein